VDRKRYSEAGEAEESDIQKRAWAKTEEQEEETEMTKRSALYCRVSTGDQHLETQLLDLRELARQRGFEIVGEYTDIISGAKSKRPGLERLMADARRRRFDVLLVAAFDRIARNVRHFLEVLDELHHLGVEFISLRENIDTSGPLGRAMVVIVGAIAELERSLIVERVRAGMRRAKLEGRRIGRTPLQVDRAALLRDRQRGLSLNQLARAYQISKASVCRVLNEAKTPVSIASVATASPSVENQELAPLKMSA
jgi:DNA invertase Pin-like site-specific DNA recombinase